MTKTIQVSGRPVAFKASAAIPRLYRIQFRRDLFQDMKALEQALGENAEGEFLTIPDLELFENVAYIMAKHATPTAPDTVEEWLDQFEMFSIVEILPQLLELWAIDQEALVESKRNFEQPTGR